MNRGPKGRHFAESADRGDGGVTPTGNALSVTSDNPHYRK